ncbi:MAG: DUF58 domain-containing protein [Thermoguttaceae bacterium]|nr:DUF58 domain-containing protein [Thermoguttaceae bacterium]MDW8039091.1 DUF58 domain-containing protein [Thermoguttaceae bacterium]
MSLVAKYLKPEVVRQIRRLDLRAKFIVRGFFQGLHRSPFHGFSVEFSEHRKYTPGDDPKDIDWIVYAKTDKYYVKKFEAETNITGYLTLDLSRSMGYTYRQEVTKWDYAVSLAAALCYLMIQQQDPVGLFTFDEKVRASLRPKSKRTQLGDVLAILARSQPTGRTDVAACLTQIAGMLRHASLVMVFSDLLGQPEPILQALYRLRHRGHDVIVFHILDEAEVRFPFDGLVELEEPETGQLVEVDASDFRHAYLEELQQFQNTFRRECAQAKIDYVPLDTSMPFDRALSEYLINRSQRS